MTSSETETKTTSEARVFNWKSVIERSRSFPEVDEKDDNGDVTGTKRILVNRIRVVLTHEKYGQIIFRVSLRNNKVSFIDTREEKTGSCQSTFGDKKIGGGKKVSLTATAWINEMDRYIGSERASEIVDEILFP